MNLRRALVTFPLLWLVGCSHSAAVPDPADGPFIAEGEISFIGYGASFNAHRVVGPRINVSRRSDGSWGGRFNEQVIDVSVTETRVSGVNFLLAFTQEGGKNVITGQWQGRILRYELGPEQALIRTPNRSFTLPRKDDHSFGPRGELVLLGDAALPAPPMPQFAFALAGTF